MARSATAEERLRLVERLRGLPVDDWDRPSLCEGWTVRHVAAHLVTPFLVSRSTMAVAVTRHRSIGAAMDAVARRVAATLDPEEMLATLAANADSTFRPPGLPAAAPLTDAVAHSADIRWALGDPVADWADSSRLLPVLAFLVGVRARAGFVPPRRLRGVELISDDQPWRHGSGKPVHGPSIGLAMAVLGRRPASQLLTGDGAPLLTGVHGEASA